MNNDQALHPCVTVVDTSPKVLADTLLEIGAIEYNNKKTIERLSEELRWVTNQRNELGNANAKLSILVTETKEQLNKRVEQLDQMTKRLDDLHNSVEYYSRKDKRGITVRDAIISELLAGYHISRAHKRKIKELLEPETVVVCGGEAPNNYAKAE
jgi:uncharacterized coiled-coil protein SlyX